MPFAVEGILRHPGSWNRRPGCLQVGEVPGGLISQSPAGSEDDDTERRVRPADGGNRRINEDKLLAGMNDAEIVGVIMTGEDGGDRRWVLGYQAIKEICP